MTLTQRVAIVDDEPSVRSGLSNLLQSDGYATLTFASAEAFLNDIPARNDTALVIVDIKLKGMSGVALFEALQQSPTPPPVIFISGHDDETGRDTRDARVPLLFCANPSISISCWNIFSAC